MATVKNFEDLLIWQKAIEFCDDIFKLINNSDLSKDFALRDQLNRASISIASNIAEGFDRESNNQFSYFLKVSKGSAGELRTQLHIAKRRGYLSEEKFKELECKIIHISKMASSLLAYMRDFKKESGFKEPQEEYIKLINQLN